MAKFFTVESDKKTRQSWRTPRVLFDTLHHIFEFTIDAAADHDNALLPRYWTEEQNCLFQDWSQERVFCNPPYRNIRPFLEKGTTARLAVFLLPVTCLTTLYFKRYPPLYFAFPPYRIRFDPPPGLTRAGADGAAMGSAILLYGDVTQEHLRSLREDGMHIYLAFSR